MNVYEALEWALDCLAADDEVIGEAQTYTLNSVTMGRSTDYAANLDEARLAASPGARHDVPDLDVERLARAITTAIDGADTPLRNVDYEEARDIAAEYARLSPEPAARPPVLVPRDEPTREDIEG